MHVCEHFSEIGPAAKTPPSQLYWDWPRAYADQPGQCELHSTCHELQYTLCD